jgi:hypothetical protein
MQVSRVQKTLDMLEYTLTLFPDLSVEIIQFWSRRWGRGFLETLHPGMKLQERLHVIEIMPGTLNKLQRVFGSSEIRECFLKNVGVRLAQGEMIMFGREDVYPSPALYEIVQHELGGVLTVYEANRTFSSFERQQARYRRRSESPNSGSVFTRQNFSRGFERANYDLQGGSRKQIWALNGWNCNADSADRAFSMDRRTFKVPWYQMSLPVSASHSESWLRVLENESEVSYCRGIPSKNTNAGRRPGWGIWHDYGSKGRIGYRLVRWRKAAPFVSRLELVEWNVSDGV